jgi:hypothetical protein
VVRSGDGRDRARADVLPHETEYRARCVRFWSGYTNPGEKCFYRVCGGRRVVVKAVGSVLEGVGRLGAHLLAKPKTEPRGFGFDLCCKAWPRWGIGGVQSVAYTAVDEVASRIQECRQVREFGPTNRKSSFTNSIPVKFA